LHRAGELTAVWMPDGLQEALRDLTRAREDMKHLERQAKQRLLVFLPSHGKRHTGKSNWTQAHMRWLETVKFEQPVQQIVMQEYIDKRNGTTTLFAALNVLDGQVIAQCQQRHRYEEWLSFETNSCLINSCLILSGSTLSNLYH